MTTSVADWFKANCYLNEVLKAMREVFDRAEAMAPCILFLDEIDSVPNRLTLDSRNADYWMPICNDLLMRLDNRPVRHPPRRHRDRSDQ